MKKMKKVIAMFLTLIMVLAMALTANADGETAAGGTIKVTGAEGTTYTVIKMFDATSVGNEVYTYVSTADWEGFDGTDYAAEYLTIDDTSKKVTIKDKTKLSDAAFAAKAADYATNNNITSETKVTASTGGNTVTVKEDGYYLLLADGGGISGVVHVVGGEEVSVTEKTTSTTHYPTLTKEVEEDSTGTYGESNTVDIGQVINYKITIEAAKGGTNYVLHDKMASQLSFIKVTKVAKLVKTESDGNTTLTEDVITSGYTVDSSALTDGCTFEVSFADSLFADIEHGTAFVVYYTAYLNDTATANTEYINEAWLTHSEGDTPVDTTKTKTYDFSIKKFDGSKNPLAGAGFTLTNSSNNVISLFEIKDGEYKVCEMEDCKEHTHTEIAVSDLNGMISIIGLDNDDYTIEETQVPQGYVKAKIVMVTIPTQNATEITNTLGESLPETGGIGTTIFYILGTILVLGAGVTLVTKRRMSR